jgi:hypothetical protein
VSCGPRGPRSVVVVRRSCRRSACRVHFLGEFDASVFLGHSSTPVKRRKRGVRAQGDARGALQDARGKNFPLATRNTADPLYNRAAANFHLPYIAA